MEKLQEKTVSTQEIFSGKVLKLRVDQVLLPNGNLGEREIVSHPGAVSIVAITGNREIIMLRQFRKAVEETIWEIPAGKLQPGEDPAECAVRELAEETGYRAGEMRKLMSFYTTPGFSDEVMHLFLATKLEKQQQCLDEDEFLEVEKVPLLQAKEMIASGIIKDAKTIAGILALISFERF